METATKPLITSYWIDNNEHGIVSLTVNLRNKCTQIVRQGNEDFWLEDEDEGIKHTVEKIPGLPPQGALIFRQFFDRCKDQVYYVWIPTYLLVQGSKMKSKCKERYKEYLSQH